MVKIDCNIGIKDDAAKGTVKKTAKHACLGPTRRAGMA